MLPESFYVPLLVNLESFFTRGGSDKLNIFMGKNKIILNLVPMLRKNAKKSL